MLPNVRHKGPIDLQQEFFPLSPKEKETEHADIWRFRHRLEAADICDYQLKPLADIAERRYTFGGSWADFGYFVDIDRFDHNEVFAVMNAILKSPLPNHQQRYAALALGLHNWFQKASPEEMAEYHKLKTSLAKK